MHDSSFQVRASPFAAANGRATVSLEEPLGGTAFNQSVYLVDDNTALTLDTDTRRSLVGLLKRQF